MRLLKDSANKENKRIYLTLFEAIRQQYDQGNMKLYLKQKYDTAAFFTIFLNILNSPLSLIFFQFQNFIIREKYWQAERRNLVDFMRTDCRNLAMENA